MIWEPIETRYKKENRMFHSAAFAIAAGVVGVAAAGAGAAVNISSANRAAGAMAGASKSAQRREQETLNRFREAMGQVQAPQWNVGRDIGDAGQITEYNYAEMQKRFPESMQTMANISKAVEAQTRGELDPDFQRMVRQTVAENVGASFVPRTTQSPIGGFQTAEALSAATFGNTMQAMRQQGMMNFWNMMQNAGLYTESPLQVGQSRLGYEQAAADVQMQKAAAEAGIALDLSGRQYGRAVDTIGSRLAANQAVGTSIQSVGSALSGGISGFGKAQQASQMASMGAASPNTQGFYQDPVSAANAFNVAPSQLSFQRSTGGMLGVGGQRGGYYYTPGGVYGR